jgi:hypothetical protein
MDMIEPSGRYPDKRDWAADKLTMMKGVGSEMPFGLTLCTGCTLEKLSRITSTVSAQPVEEAI